MYFEWSDGTPVTYTKWHHGEPTHTRNKADCVIIKGEVKIPLTLSWFLLFFVPQKGNICDKTNEKKSKRDKCLKDFYELGFIQNILVWRINGHTSGKVYGGPPEAVCCAET